MRSSTSDWPQRHKKDKLQYTSNDQISIEYDEMAFRRTCGKSCNELHARSLKGEWMNTYMLFMYVPYFEMNK